MEYKPAARALIISHKRAAITWIITPQTKHFFRGESNQLAEFVLTKNNLRAQNTLIYHTEAPLTLYRDEYPPTAGKNASLIGRTSLRRTAAATRRPRPIPRWKSMTFSGSTSPMASGKSIRIYASGIWKASATSTPQCYQRAKMYAPLACSIYASAPTEIRLIARPHMKNPSTW